MTKEHETIQRLLSVIHQLKAVLEDISTTCKPSMDGEIYLGHEEVCELLHVSRRTLQQYRDDGVLPYIQLPGKVIYKESDIIKLLEKNYKGVME